jgi:hypothetical protein
VLSGPAREGAADLAPPGDRTPVYSRKVWSVVQQPGIVAAMVGADSGDVGAEWKTGAGASASRVYVIQARQLIPLAPSWSPWSGVP